MEQLLMHPKVDSVTCDQCAYGLYSKSPDGQWRLSLKPTRWASSSHHMLRRLSRRCKGGHIHQHLEGGLASKAAYYPRRLVLEILRGVRDTEDAEHVDLEEQEEQQTSSMCMNSGFCSNDPEHTYEREFADRDIAYAVSQKSTQF